MSVERVMDGYRQHGDLQRALHEAGYPHLASAIGAGPDVQMSKPEIRPNEYVGPKPEDNAHVHAGGKGERPATQKNLNPQEREQVRSGGHIRGLDDEDDGR